MTDIRATQAAVLVLGGGDADVRVTQGAVLALLSSDADVRVTQGAVLALVGTDAGTRITQAPVLALAESVPCLTHWCQCWKITRTDGEVFAFTSLDTDFVFMGDTYRHCDSLNATASELAAIVGDVGNVEISGIISDDSITEADIFAGLYDGARVEVWIVPWQGDEIPWRLTAGIVGQVGQGQSGYTMELLTPGALLQQRALVQTYTADCRFKLGDSRCTVDLEAYTVTGTVTAVASLLASTAANKRVFADADRTEEDNWYAYGEIRWLTGDNAGATAEIKSSLGANGQIILAEPMLHPIAIGDTYEAVAGCDRLSSTCKTKFDNYINNGSFDKLPGQDAIMQTPDAKQ